MDKAKSMIQRLKAYYQKAEREAARSAPYYVSEEGGLFADPQEVLHSQIVRAQLKAFSKLQQEIKVENDSRQAHAHP